MKRRFSQLLAIAAIALTISRVQGQTITYTNLYLPWTTNVTQPKISLAVQPNQLARVLWANIANNTSGAYLQGDIQVTVGKDTFSYGDAVRFNSIPTTSSTLPFYGVPPPPVIAGPATITLLPASWSTYNKGLSAPALCTIELVTPSTPVGTTAPSTAVVIPADSGGPVNIILESSTDLITWTAALPGTYGTSTQKRFFRVRAERLP